MVVVMMPIFAEGLEKGQCRFLQNGARHRGGEQGTRVGGVQLLRPTTPSRRVERSDARHRRRGAAARGAGERPAATSSGPAGAAFFAAWSRAVPQTAVATLFAAIVCTDPATASMLPPSATALAAAGRPRQQRRKQRHRRRRGPGRRGVRRGDLAARGAELAVGEEAVPELQPLHGGLREHAELRGEGHRLRVCEGATREGHLLGEASRPTRAHRRGLWTPETHGRGRSIIFARSGSWAAWPHLQGMDVRTLAPRDTAQLPQAAHCRGQSPTTISLAPLRQHRPTQCCQGARKEGGGGRSPSGGSDDNQSGGQGIDARRVHTLLQEFSPGKLGCLGH
mmetsp:Transcript_156585/g.502632  ORF Transcript_156585/g.502632 Transcript_156585/m.502632 type:complete len:337 (-) Transcript_156585:191-1201(-)